MKRSEIIWRIVERQPRGRLRLALRKLVRAVSMEVGFTRKLKEFLKFHEANPHVYELLERFTLEATKRRPYFGIQAVYERMRWFTQIETFGEELKLNDHHRTLYARLFMLHHPEHEGFFELRRLHPE